VGRKNRPPVCGGPSWSSQTRPRRAVIAAPYVFDRENPATTVGTRWSSFRTPSSTFAGASRVARLARRRQAARPGAADIAPRLTVGALLGYPGVGAVHGKPCVCCSPRSGHREGNSQPDLTTRSVSRSRPTPVRATPAGPFVTTACQVVASSSRLGLPPYCRVIALPPTVGRRDRQGAKLHRRGQTHRRCSHSAVSAGAALSRFKPYPAGGPQGSASACAIRS